MLLDSADADSVKRTLVYVMGGDRVSVGAMDGLSILYRQSLKRII